MYMNITSARLFHSPLKSKKYRVVFYDEDDKELQHTDFGAKGMSDFTIHNDGDRKQRFINRFQKLIKKDKNDPTKPITLSLWLLWNKSTLEKSWRSYLRHFNLV